MGDLIGSGNSFLKTVGFGRNDRVHDVFLGDHRDKTAIDGQLQRRERHKVWYVFFVSRLVEPLFADRLIGKAMSNRRFITVP